MNQKEYNQIRANANQLLTRHNCNGSTNPDSRESCGVCALNGYHPKGEKRNFINYAGWARIYIQAGKLIPVSVQFDFMADLASQNRAYAEALIQDIKDFGINCESGDFRDAVRNVLEIYD